MVRALFTSGFLTLVLVTPVLAEPITVNFKAFPAPNDPVNRGPSRGFFTFDSSMIPAGGGQVQDSTFGLHVDEIRFQWGSTLWSAANADVGELLFDRSGGLSGFVLGGIKEGRQGGIYSYTTGPPAAVIDDIFASAFFNPRGSITYTLAGIGGDFQGSLVTDAFASPTPEPASLLLLAAGAAVVGRTRWRRRKRGEAPATSSTVPL